MAKIETRCPTPKCVSAIKRWGEHYHSVCTLKGEHYKPGAEARCERCGGILVDGEWEHRCQVCETDVAPGKLVGLFVPHMCEACYKDRLDRDKKSGRVCLKCHKPYAACYC